MSIGRPGPHRNARVRQSPLTFECELARRRGRWSPHDGTARCARRSAPCHFDVGPQIRHRSGNRRRLLPQLLVIGLSEDHHPAQGSHRPPSPAWRGGGRRVGLWHRLLRRSAFESGSLCREGGGSRTGRSLWKGARVGFALDDVILGAISYWKTELDISASAAASWARRGTPCLSDRSFAAAEDPGLGHCRGRDLVRSQAR